MHRLGLLLAVVALAAAAENASYINVYGYLPAEGGPAASQRQISLEELYSRPVVVLADVTNVVDRSNFDQILSRPDLVGRTFTGYYLHNGVQSLFQEEKFRQLYSYVATSEGLSGLAFYPRGVFSPAFLKNFVDRVAFPDGFTLFDFFRDFSSNEAPVLYLLPQVDLFNQGISGVYQIGNLRFSNSTEEDKFGPFPPYYPFPNQPQYPSFPFRPQYPSFPFRPQYPSFPFRPQYPSFPFRPQYPNFPFRPQYPNFPFRPQYPQYPNFPNRPQYPFPGPNPYPFPRPNPFPFPPNPGNPGQDNRFPEPTSSPTPTGPTQDFLDELKKALSTTPSTPVANNN